MAQFTVKFREVNNQFIATFNSESEFKAEFDTVIEVMGEVYTGEYIFTPSAEQQTAETKNKALTENIVINPIPNNYGLITWNGSILTVS